MTPKAKVYALSAIGAAIAIGVIVGYLVFYVPLQAEQQKTQGVTEAGPCRQTLFSSLSVGHVDRDPECSLQTWLILHNACAHGWLTPHECAGLRRQIPSEVQAILDSRKGVVPGSGGGSNPGGLGGPGEGPPPPKPPLANVCVEHPNLQACVNVPNPLP